MGDMTRPTFKVTPYRTEKKPGGVNADQPVSPGPADRRVIERIVVAARTQVFKAVPDCRILHTGNPEAFHWFAASGILIDKAEDQLALTSGVCWIVGIGDLENIHYSRVSSAPMNL